MTSLQDLGRIVWMSFASASWGEHLIGLNGRKHMHCSSQEDLLKLIVHMANENVKRGASEPAVQIELLSGQYPAYATLKRRDSKLAVEDIEFHCSLDTRPGRPPDRTMMALICTWGRIFWRTDNQRGG